MQVRHVALASLKRRRSRAAFVLAAVALGVGTVVAIVSLSRAMRDEIANELDRFGANIIVTPASRTVVLAYGAIGLGALTVDPAALSLADVDRIGTIHHRTRLSAVAPKLVGMVEVNGAAHLLIGLRFREERALKSWWELEGRMAVASDEIVLGSELARALHLNAGGRLTIAGRSLLVAGIARASGSLEDGAIMADLAEAQALLGRPDAISFIEISALCKGCPIDEIVGQIAAVLPRARVAPIRQAVAARERAVEQFTRFGYGAAAVVLIVGALVVLTTMLSSVIERTQELGVLRAVGFRRVQIARLVLIEAIAAAAGGGLAGWMSGSAVAWWSSGPAILQLGVRVEPDWRLAVSAVVLATAIGAFGGMYPALRATRMDPAHALRHF